jgi:hypothetical protein
MNSPSLTEEQQEEPIDICSQINLISSIQYQQNELSKLAKLLQSEKDREKYIKVIEMSKIIQSKLDLLYDEKKKNNSRNSFGQQLDKKNSMWSLNQYNSNDYYSRSCSRSSTASSQTSENTIATLSSTGGGSHLHNSALYNHNNNNNKNSSFVDGGGNDESSSILFTGKKFLRSCKLSYTDHMHLHT